MRGRPSVSYLPISSPLLLESIMIHDTPSIWSYYFSLSLTISVLPCTSIHTYLFSPERLLHCRLGLTILVQLCVSRPVSGNVHLSCRTRFRDSTLTVQCKPLSFLRTHVTRVPRSLLSSSPSWTPPRPFGPGPVDPKFLYPSLNLK